MIELNYIGTVSPGDEIVIKATLERGTDREDPGFVEKPLFRKVIKIQRINPYVRMSGSIIMANPYTRDQARFQGIIDLENTYQFAPTYGIILRKAAARAVFTTVSLTWGSDWPFLPLISTPMVPPSWCRHHGNGLQGHCECGLGLELWARCALQFHRLQHSV
jgi:hypothetical protein